MSEKILEVKDVRDRRTLGYGVYDGYDIVTDKRTIFLGIDNRQDCCEDWGYFSTPEDPQEFIGATLLQLKVDGNECLLQTLRDIAEGYCYAEFINLETDRGTLQFVIYNEYNGYYGHACVVYSGEECIKQEMV